MTKRSEQLRSADRGGSPRSAERIGCVYAAGARCRGLDRYPFPSRCEAAVPAERSQ